MAIDHDAIVVDRGRSIARLIVIEGSPDRIASALHHAREQMELAAQGQEGWLRTVGLTSADGRRGVIIGYWKDEESALASNATFGALRQQAQAAGISITEMARYEVVFDDGVE